MEEQRPQAYRLFRQPGARSARAENLANLPPDYDERAAVAKKPEWIKVYIDSDYGMVQDGKPIYSEYSDREHCRPAEIVPGLPSAPGRAGLSTAGDSAAPGRAGIHHRAKDRSWTAQRARRYSGSRPRVRLGAK